MEDSVDDSNRKKIREYIVAYGVILTSILLALGIIMIVAGTTMYFYNSNKIQHIITLGVGVLITLVAFVTYVNKALQWYKSWRRRTSEPTFETFTDHIEAICADKELVPSPDLEMNDQHLPSGILRLNES